MPPPPPNGIPYYATTRPPRAARAALEGATSARVCIVGGGFAGLATALGLVERGVDAVVLVESEHIGYGASGRNGGFVFGGYSLEPAELLRQLGAAEARALYALTLDAVALIRRRIRAYAIDCTPVEGGALLADWFGDERTMRRRQALMNEVFGARWRWIARDELAAWVDSPRYHGALLEPDAFHFDPLAYALGIAAAAERGGARLHEGTRAAAIERRGDGYRVRTARGHVDARHVIVAGGGHLRGLLPALERAMLPVATYVMVTEPLGEAASRWIPSDAAIYDTRFAFDYYHRLADTRLLWGGRISVRDRSPAAVARLLQRDMARVFPASRDARVDHAWSGTMSYARHAMPQLGALADGLWHAVGFGGHGVAPTTVAGELLAAAIASAAPLPAAFARYGLQAMPRPLALAAAQCRYTASQWRDRLREAWPASPRRRA